MTTVENVDAPRTPSASRLCTIVALAGSTVGLVCLLVGNGLPALGHKLAQAAALLGEAAAPLSLIVGSIALLLACLKFPRFGRIVGACLDWPVRIVLTAVFFLMWAVGITIAVAMTAVAVVGWGHGMGVPVWFLAPSELPPTVVFGGFALGISLTALTYCRVPLEVTGGESAKTPRRDKVSFATVVAFFLLVFPGVIMGSKPLGEARTFHRTGTTASQADASLPPVR